MTFCVDQLINTVIESLWKGLFAHSIAEMMGKKIRCDYWNFCCHQCEKECNFFLYFNILSYFNPLNFSLKSPITLFYDINIIDLVISFVGFVAYLCVCVCLCERMVKVYFNQSRQKRHTHTYKKKMVNEKRETIANCNLIHFI